LPIPAPAYRRCAGLSQPARGGRTSGDRRARAARVGGRSNESSRLRLGVTRSVSPGAQARVHAHNLDIVAGGGGGDTGDGIEIATFSHGLMGGDVYVAERHDGHLQCGLHPARVEAEALLDVAVIAAGDEGTQPDSESAGERRGEPEPPRAQGDPENAED